MKKGIDYIKAYNKKINKTKSKLTYVPINLEAYMNLKPAEKAQITKIVKSIDLRKERKVKGSNVSIKTRDLLKTLERYSNKRITEFSDKYKKIKLRAGGNELPEQSQEVYANEGPQRTNINVVKLRPKEILRKSESFQRHFYKNFYDETTKRMQDNYIQQLEFLFGITGYENHESLLKYIRELSPDKFYEVYLENIEMRVPFEISPNTRKKIQIETPIPEPQDLYESLAVASGYANEIRKNVVDDIKEIFNGTKINTKDIINKINNLDITAFFEEYENNNFNIQFNNPDATYNSILKGLKNAKEKR